VSSESTVAVTMVGSVKGKNVMMFDDMITTAGTVCEAAKLARENGAVGVYVAATHAVFAGAAVQRLSDAEFNEIVVTDTIPQKPEVCSRLKNLTVLSVSNLVGEAIRRIHEHRSVSALFC
jgi:ribose-phosphate pyrophosphokinase